jgi:hypothetical protein
VPRGEEGDVAVLAVDASSHRSRKKLLPFAVDSRITIVSGSCGTADSRPSSFVSMSGQNATSEAWTAV